MLFCHAGFNVNSILLDGAEEEISANLLKEITGHSPWSNENKPNWVKADIKYPVCVVIEPSEEFQKVLLTENDEIATPLAEAATRSHPVARLHSPILGAYRNDDKSLRYIKEHCEFIKILQKEEIANQSLSNDLKKRIIAIPENPLKLRNLFEKILSDTIRFVASKVLDGEITYCFKGDFSKIDYIKDLEKAFVEDGVEKSWIATPSARNDGNYSSSVVLAKGEKEIEIVFEANEAEIKPTRNRIYVSKHKNGLLLTDSIETRLLPDFSCQSCFARFVSYLKTELSRN